MSPHRYFLANLEDLFGSNKCEYFRPACVESILEAQSSPVKVQMHSPSYATQGVTWIVMNEPAIIGQMQLDEYRTFVALFDDSKVQNRGERR